MYYVDLIYNALSHGEPDGCGLMIATLINALKTFNS